MKTLLLSLLLTATLHAQENIRVTEVEKTDNGIRSILQITGLDGSYYYLQICESDDFIHWKITPVMTIGREKGDVLAGIPCSKIVACKFWKFRLVKMPYDYPL